MFDQEGEVIIATSSDGDLLAIDPIDGRVMWKEQKWHNGMITRTTCNRDGSQVATCGEDNCIRVRFAGRSLTESEQITLRSHAQPAFSLAFESGSGLLSSISKDGLRDWNTSESKRFFGTLAFGDYPRAIATGPMAFSGDGRFIVASEGDRFRIWDRASLKPIGGPFSFPETPRFHARFIAIDPECRLIAAASFSEVRIWRPESPDPIGAPLQSPHDSTINFLRFTSDGQLLIGSSDGIDIWNIASQVPTKRSLPTGGGAVAMSSDGRFVAIKDWHRIQVWNIQSGELGLTLNLAELVFGDDVLVFGPNDQSLISGNRHAITIWDIASIRTARAANHAIIDDVQGTVFAANCGEVESLALCADGRTLAVGRERSIQLWDLATRLPIGDPLLASCAAVEFDPRGTTLACIGRTGIHFYSTKLMLEFARELHAREAQIDTAKELLASELKVISAVSDRTARWRAMHELAARVRAGTSIPDELKTPALIAIGTAELDSSRSKDEPRLPHRYQRIADAGEWAVALARTAELTEDELNVAPDRLICRVIHCYIFRVLPSGASDRDRTAVLRLAQNYARRNGRSILLAETYWQLGDKGKSIESLRAAIDSTRRSPNGLASELGEFDLESLNQILRKREAEIPPLPTSQSARPSK